MEERSFNFKSKDGLQLYGHAWDISKPTGVVCMVHGMGEHIQRYHHVAQAFGRANLAFWGFDLRGHGHSEGKKGHTPSIVHFFDDIEAFLLEVRTTHPDIPVILYGHSMGGNLALNFMLQRPSKETSLGVITSPWLRLSQPPTGLKLWMAKFGARFMPALAQPNRLDIADISSVKEEQEAYANDPLNHDRITAGLFMEINGMGAKAIEMAGTLQTPILLAHGSEDAITSASASEEFARAAPENMVDFKLWIGLRHETHNEHTKEDVIGFYVDWVVGKLRSS